MLSILPEKKPPPIKGFTLSDDSYKEMGPVKVTMLSLLPRGHSVFDKQGVLIL